MLRTARQWYLAAVLAVVATSSRHARTVLAVILALTLAVVYYVATHLAIDTDTDNMLDPELPFRQVERRHDEAFPQLSGQLVVVIEGDNAGGVEDTADWIAGRLRERPDLVESVYVPGAEPFFARNGLLYLDTEELWALDEQLAQAQPFLGTMAADPSLRGLFTMLGLALEQTLSPANERALAHMFERISEVMEAQIAGRPAELSWRDAWLDEAAPGGRGRRRFVIVQPHRDFSQIEPARLALDFVRELTHDPGVKASGARARITGSVAMEGEELANVSEDAHLVTLLSAILVCLILFAGLRSPRLVLSIFVSLFVGLCWTAAFAAFAIGSLNLISVSFAVLFIGMGVDFGIQFGMRYREESGRRPGGIYGALCGTARGMGGALTLAAVAAAISFFAFVPTSYRGLAELGIISGVSMFVALGVNLTVLPAMLTLVGAQAPLALDGRHAFTRVSTLVIRHRRVVLAITAALTIASLVVLPRLDFDINPVNLRDPTTESVATFRDLLADPDTTPYTIDVLASDLDAARALAPRLAALPQASRVVTLASLVPEDQPEKLEIIGDINTALGALGGAPANAERPGVEANLAALTALREHLARKTAGDAASDSVFDTAIGRLAQAIEALAASPGWPAPILAELEPRIVGDFPKLLRRLQELLQAGPVTLADLPAELATRYVTADGRARIEVYPAEDLKDNRAMRRFVAAVRTVAPDAAGTPVTLIEGGNAVITACVQAAILALAATAALVAIVLRSTASVLLVLLPLMLAIILTAGISVLLGLQLNFANIIALPLLIGLNNAFGIYLVMRQRTRGVDSVSALFDTSTPRAVLLSVLATMASFGSLAVARHPGMSRMGILISISLGVALVCALVVVPAVIAEIEARHRP